MTLLVLFTGTTWAGIVAADFFLASNHLLDGLRVAGSGHTGLLQLTALAAHEGFFEIIR